MTFKLPGTAVQTLKSPNEFESASRFIRWVVIVVVALTFPIFSRQTYYVYVFCAIASMYNVLRYMPSLLRNRLFASPALVIGVDTVFVCILIALVGNVSTPYSAFLFLMVASSAYWYRMKGVLLVVSAQVVLIGVTRQLNLFGMIEFSFYRNIAIIIAALMILGMLVERLTRVDKEEKDAFRQLAKDNKTESLLLRGLVDGLRSAIFVVDKSGNILLNNGAADAMSGASEDFKNKPFHKVMNLYLRADPDKKRIKILKSNTDHQHRRDLRLELPNGQTLDLDVTVTPVQSSEAKASNYVIICEDITHELSLNDQQQEFISVASHELRTPIAIMEAALSTLLHTKDTLPPITVQIIEQAHGNAMLLSGIVKDLAMMAEAKNDNIPIQLENINAARLASLIADDFKQQIEHKGLTFELVIEPKLPTILSTERHIREILQNYMTNALKYSYEGSIVFKTARAKNGGIEFSVKDTGIGISPSAQRNLFNKFFRAEDPKIQRIGGTGLGLYLCRELAVRLGAKVWCESELGKGSTFYLEVPPFSGLRRDSGEVVKTEVANLVDSI